MGRGSIMAWIARGFGGRDGLGPTCSGDRPVRPHPSLLTPKKARNCALFQTLATRGQIFTVQLDCVVRPRSTKSARQLFSSQFILTTL